MVDVVGVKLPQVVDNQPMHKNRYALACNSFCADRVPLAVQPPVLVKTYDEIIVLIIHERNVWNLYVRTPPAVPFSPV